mmetsp:Transcript_20106/g.50164  ORF Transcript_20106/g.50164 Transcript_20106/m.50164 type:complete len:112 (-) Transcript_20106:886-1221(-)
MTVTTRKLVLPDRRDRQSADKGGMCFLCERASAKSMNSIQNMVRQFQCCISQALCVIRRVPAALKNSVLACMLQLQLLMLWFLCNGMNPALENLLQPLQNPESEKLIPRGV